jgi:Tfp pilus assembly protein PilN
LLQDLARLTPSDVVLREVHWEGGAVALRGQAGSANAISAYMIVLERESVLVHRVQWGELQGAAAHASEPGALSFLLTAQLRERAAVPRGGRLP